jgi:hypothetical protein
LRPTLADIAQIVSLLGSTILLERPFVNRKACRRCGRGQRGGRKATSWVYLGSSGGPDEPSMHGSPLGPDRLYGSPRQAAATGGPCRRTIRASIFTSISRKVVSVHYATSRGSARLRRSWPGYRRARTAAGAPRCPGRRGRTAGSSAAPAYLHGSIAPPCPVRCRT